MADAMAAAVNVASSIAPEAKPQRDYITRWPQCDVHYLILAGDDFIVFLDKDLDVDWSATEEWLGSNPGSSERGEILNLVASVECIPNDHQKANVRLNFKRMVGEGVARALDGEYESAKEMLEEARGYINARNIEKARYWQLCTACTIGMSVLLGSLFLWRFRSFPIQTWGESVYYLTLAAMAGSIGAVLSMIFRMGKSSPTSESPRALHILEAGSRILAGCFSALLTSGAVQVGLILSILSGRDQLHAMMLVVGFASGASERLAPSIIARIENSPIEGVAKKTKPQRSYQQSS
jgi:hypothetical protein